MAEPRMETEPGQKAARYEQSTSSTSEESSERGAFLEKRLHETVSSGYKGDMAIGGQLSPLTEMKIQRSFTRMKMNLFSIGPFIRTTAMEADDCDQGVLSAYYMVEYRAKKKQMDWEKVFPLTVWSVRAGFWARRFCIF